MPQLQPSESNAEDRRTRTIPEREPGMPFTRAEYAARQRVSEKTINRLLKAGLPHLRVGKLIRIEPAVADAWLAQRAPGRAA